MKKEEYGSDHRLTRCFNPHSGKKRSSFFCWEKDFCKLKRERISTPMKYSLSPWQHGTDTKMCPDCTSTDVIGVRRECWCIYFSSCNFCKKKNLSEMVMKEINERISTVEPPFIPGCKGLWDACFGEWDIFQSIMTTLVLLCWVFLMC